MAFLFRLPGDSTGVIVQYRPFWKISSLHLPTVRNISVYGTENIEVKVPHTLFVQLMPNDMLECDLPHFRAGVKYQIYELHPDFSALRATPLRYGNVAGDGVICWGRGNVVPYDLREASRTYWGAPFNGDLTEEVLRDIHVDDNFALGCYMGVSKAKPASVKDYFTKALTDISKEFVRPTSSTLTKEDVAKEAAMLAKICDSWAEYTYLTYVYRALNIGSIPAEVAAYATKVITFYNTLSGRLMTAVNEVDSARTRLDEIKNELAYNEECACLDCVLAKKNNASRIQIATDTLKTLEDRYAGYISVNARVAALSDIPGNVTNAMRNVVNQRRLLAHLKDYRTPGTMEDCTVDLLGTSHIAINQKADAIFITAVREEIGKFDEKCIRMRNGVPIIIGLCKYIGEGKYVVDAGGSAVIYEPAAKKDKIIPFDPAILSKKDAKSVEPVNEAAAVAAIV